MRCAQGADVGLAQPTQSDLEAAVCAQRLNRDGELYSESEDEKAAES